MSYHDAITMIQRRRPQAQPIPEFVTMLQQLELTITTATATQSNLSCMYMEHDAITRQTAAAAAATTQRQKGISIVKKYLFRSGKGVTSRDFCALQFRRIHRVLGL